MGMKFTVKRYIPFYPLLVFFIQCINLGGCSFKRLPHFLLYLLRFTLLEPLRYLEVLFFERRIQTHKLKQDPIFVIGHWRSGTTHAQHLLSKDPNHQTLNLFEMIFADQFIVTELWLLPLLNWFIKRFRLKYTFQRTALDLTLPGEFDPALCALGSRQAYTWGHLFPKSFELWMQRNLFIVSGEHELEDYDYLIRKLSFYSKNKRIVVKSPGDTARLSSLIKRYPNARFVYMERPTFETICSTQYLWTSILKENSLQQTDEHVVHEQILVTYTEIMKRYHSDKTNITMNQLHAVTLAELHKQPEKMLIELYERLSLGVYPAEAIKSYIDSNQAHQTANYPQDSALAGSLRKRLAPFYKD